MPIPLVENNGRWTFDTKAGAQTIIDRRIGRNELSAIRTLLACVDAQRDYFDRAKQANGSGEYATRMVSTPGRRDGLYWPVAEGEAESPLGPLIDAAQDAGYPGELVGGKPIPYEGYYFRILKAQGPNGDGGAKSYIQSGRMIGGFALIAWPAVFKSSGIMTFIVGPDGDVYQKDLGPETARIAAGNDGVRPGPYMVTCGDDERVTSDILAGRWGAAANLARTSRRGGPVARLPTNGGPHMSTQYEPDHELEDRLSRRLLDIFIRAGLVLVLVLLCYLFFSPFLTMMLWALILAITIYPLHQMLAHRIGGKQGLAATLIVFLSLGLIVAPTILLAS